MVMPFPTSRVSRSTERVADSIDGAFSSMLDQVEAFRSKVNLANSISSIDVRNIYQALASQRRHVEDLIASTDVPSLAAAYVRRFPSHDGNIVASWGLAKGELDQTIAWLQNNMPKDASNRPVFDAFDARGELGAYDIPLSAPAKTALITRLDTLLLAFS